jgi:uncharacterized protein
MKKTFIILLILISFSFIFLPACSKKNEDRQNVTIGGGEIMDLFNPAVNILARIINIKHRTHGIYADAVTTAGSGENIRGLFDKKLDLALVNDIPSILAYKGKGIYSNYPNHNKLRSVCSFFCDSLVFIVNEKSGISSFNDIKGKKIAIASSGSAAIGDISRYMLEFLKINPHDFKRYPYGLEKSIMELEKGNIDGFMFMLAQPNPYITAITNSQKIKCRFISINDKQLKILKSKYPSLIETKITKKMYPNSANKEDITTIGSRALLLTIEGFNQEVIYNITKEIVENFSAFNSVHSSFQKITPKSMAANLTLPVHSGALKYYKKAGLAKYIPKNLIPTDNENN